MPLADDVPNPYEMMDYMLVEREVVDLKLTAEVLLNSSCRL